MNLPHNYPSHHLNRRMIFILAPLLISLLATALSGCGTTPPASFYLLNANPGIASSHTAPLRIGLGPIEFPAYLDRSKIILRTGPNRFETTEYHRWAEPLETNFTRVLAQNLGNALPDATVSTYPWRHGQAIELQILIDVLSFDSDTNHQARLSVRWELTDAHKQSIAPPRQHEYLSTATSRDYEARVQAMSECVAELGRELAREIARVSKQ
ncbi:MAG: PqiC family protein [Gammaproteobacteria bacterium]|nr:PqiC family protein [Gammaproteobacteria bacterium]